MKKILLIADRDLGPSGVPNVIMSIVRGLKNKYIFDVIVFELNNYSFEKEFVSYGGRIIKIDIRKPDSIIGRISFYLFNYRKQVFKELENKINIKEYAAIHSFKEIFSSPFLEYAKNNNINKRIIHINRFYEKNPKLYLEYLNKRNKHKCLKYSNIRLSVSEEAGRSFFGNKDFKTVLNPLNGELYKKLPSYYNRLSLTQIGTFSNRKNQLFSLEVFKLVKNVVHDAVINFLGYEVESGYLNRMKDAIKKYGLEDSVAFFDQSYNQIDLLSKTSVCLFPSRSEAFGLVAVENRACNRPVICSTNIIKEIDCGGAVFLDFDPNAWAKAICDIYFEKKQFNIDVSRFDSKDYYLLIDSLYS